MEVLRSGYAIPFHMPPPLSKTSITLDSYGPLSIKGRALEEEIQALRCKGAVEPAPPTPSFYSRMFVITKASGGWRPIINFSTLNLSVDQTPFRMETAQTVLCSVRRNDWMVSIDLRDAYLQIPIHPASRRFLRFTAGGRTWQFRVLCFWLSTVPQVFTRVMALVSVPPSVGRLDASVSGRLADSGVFSGGSLLGKGPCSQLMPGAGNCGKFGQISLASISTDCVSGNQDRFADFQGFGDSLEDRKVLLNSRRISVLKGVICEVLEGSARPPRAEWPASHESFTTGSKARLGFSGRGDLGSLGCPFSRQSSLVVSRGSSRGGRLFGPMLSRPNVLVRRLQPKLGATVADHCVSGVWLEGEDLLSINQLELLAMERGLRALCSCLQGRVVAVFCNNTTAMAYI